MTKIHAEISLVPIGTKTASLGMYIAKAINSLKDVHGIKYEPAAMGTSIEADSLEMVFEATRKMSDAIFGEGIPRVYTVLKIDERHDKDSSLEYKIKSLKKYS